MTDEKRAEIERLAAKYVEKKLLVERMGCQTVPADLEAIKQISVEFEVAIAEFNEAEGLLREAQKYSSDVPTKVEDVPGIEYFINEYWTFRKIQLEENKPEPTFESYMKKRFACENPLITSPDRNMIPHD
jgi:hypothetical protein